jgi:hypothetical protein
LINNRAAKRAVRGRTWRGALESSSARRLRLEAQGDAGQDHFVKDRRAVVEP